MKIRIRLEHALVWTVVATVVTTSALIGFLLDRLFK